MSNDVCKYKGPLILNIFQYLCLLHFFWITLCIRLFMHPVKHPTVLWMVPHSSSKACKCFDVDALSYLAHSTCAQWVKVQETADQTITLSPFFLGKSYVSLAEWVWVLSCSNVNCWFCSWCCNSGINIGFGNLSISRHAVRVPLTMNNSRSDKGWQQEATITKYDMFHSTTVSKMFIHLLVNATTEKLIMNLHLPVLTLNALLVHCPLDSWVIKDVILVFDPFGVCDTQFCLHGSSLKQF